MTVGVASMPPHATPSRPPVTADASAFWSLERGPDVWAKYWASGGQAHRQALLQQLHALPQFRSVLEVGCAAGTNLALVREAFPWVTLSGSDINREALAYGAARLGGVEWRQADALAMLAAQPDRSQDVVVFCYTLAYLDLGDVVRMLAEVMRVARLATVIVEPAVVGASVVYVTPLFPEWAHDYAALLTAACEASQRKAAVWTARLVVPVDRCNGIFTCRFVT